MSIPTIDTSILKQLPKIASKYRMPNTKKAVIQMLTSFVPYITLRVSMYFLVQYGRRRGWIISFVNAFFLVRIFIIQHDCGHQSFFKSHTANNRIGKICSFLTFIPYSYRAAGHQFHHNHANKLREFRDIGDLYTMTVDEFAQASRWKKTVYIIFRSPLFMFVLVPIWYILLNNRLPIARLPEKNVINKSLIWNNLITLWLYWTIWYLAWPYILLHVQLPILVMFGMIAIWFFYIQHQHERWYKAFQDKREYVRAAVLWSTFYDLPKWLHWLTWNIGYHHIHHLNSAIPSYELARCYAQEPLLQQTAQKVTFFQSLRFTRCHLRDEQQQRMISFRAYRKKKSSK
jgi:omega-6 fatty acid desaturase (delta-12 desaturase)